MTMSQLYDLVKMTTSTTGTGTITLGSAVSGFLSFSGAGVADGSTVTYAITDGSNREIGHGVYTASGTTLTRSVLKSTNSNSAISLSGSATVALSLAAEDLLGIIADITTSGSQSSVTVSSIPSFYRDLEISYTVRGTVSAAITNVLMQFNGDTGVNYLFDGEHAFASSGMAADNSSGGNYVQLGLVPGATAASGYAASMTMRIHNYANTSFVKCGEGVWNGTYGTGSFQQGSGYMGFTWTSTAAITSVKLYLTSGNFADGSTVTVRGC